MCEKAATGTLQNCCAYNVMDEESVPASRFQKTYWCEQKVCY